MVNILEADSISLELNKHKLLSDVYIKSETGKITGLLGKNGTGKTSLLNIISGNIKLEDSSIRINKNHVSKSALIKNINFLPQFNFIPNSLRLNRIFNDFNLIYSDFTQVFPEFENSSKTKFGNLSGGNRRIIELYSIIKSQTNFSILDEPFSQLSPKNIELFKSLIIKEKNNKGFIITDQLYHHIIDFSNDLYLINNGKTHLINEVNEIEKYGYITAANNELNLNPN